MAAYMARRCYVLCGNVCANVIIPQPLKHGNGRINLLNDTLQPNAGYGTRSTDNELLDTQVHIPLDRLTVSYCRSSGAGGQHVNKVNTKAEIRFSVLAADWIPQDVRQKILEKNRNRINKAGELLVTSEVSRSQQRNFSDCLQKISAIIAEASEKPHEATPEDIALRASRLDKRNKERIKQKKIHSATKQSRQL
ncbi:peptidyl-tRNA hydrolase ICT1, mitochondrial [Dunckerocampus dactyliophorus]|uniref:peptidyl-tRNA hydrolase ICT1, mitochondrial n=1 Tax=Dunckerocampus dactyliophorus TaxID=161453 RepID=UPI0024052CDD|nr:peptidyl-tRNA hydrolase ICT1, mitochondrial [Dunckerocampus dactyliophorus]